MKVPAYPTPPLQTTGRNGFLLNTDFPPRCLLPSGLRDAPSPTQEPPPPLRSPPPPAAEPSPGLIYPGAFSASRNQWQTRSPEPPSAQAEEVSPRHPPRTPRAPLPHRPGLGPPHFPGARASEGCRGGARPPASPALPTPLPRRAPAPAGAGNVLSAVPTFLCCHSSRRASAGWGPVSRNRIFKKLR